MLPRTLDLPARLAEDDPAASLVLRYGTHEDHAAVEAQLSAASIIKTRTSAGIGDFIGRAYPEWIREQDEEQCFVLLIELRSSSATSDGITLAAMYAVHVFPQSRDTWWGGLRVNPAIRRCGLGRRMFLETARFCAEHPSLVGGTCRQSVASDNTAMLQMCAGLGIPSVCSTLRWDTTETDASEKAEPEADSRYTFEKLRSTDTALAEECHGVLQRSGLPQIWSREGNRHGAASVAAILGHAEASEEVGGDATINGGAGNPHATSAPPGVFVLRDREGGGAVEGYCAFCHAFAPSNPEEKKAWKMEGGGGAEEGEGGGGGAASEEEEWEGRMMIVGSMASATEGGMARVLRRAWALARREQWAGQLMVRTYEGAAHGWCRRAVERVGLTRGSQTAMVWMEWSAPDVVLAETEEAKEAAVEAMSSNSSSSAARAGQGQQGATKSRL